MHLCAMAAIAVTTNLAGTTHTYCLAIWWVHVWQVWLGSQPQPREPEIKVLACLGSHWGSLGETQVQAHSGRWQNSVPCGSKVRLSVSLLALWPCI